MLAMLGFEDSNTIQPEAATMATEDMTTEELTRRLMEAIHQPMTKKQKRERRILSALRMCSDDSEITREDVERVLDRMEGVDD